MGTGTTDIFEQCESYGLRKPEFIQDEDFLTILWRPKNSDMEVETDQGTNHMTNHVTDHVKKLILVILGDTLTRDEIMDGLGLKNRGNLRESYIKPAVSAGYATMLYPDAVRRTDQAYYLTEKGLRLLTTIRPL